MSTISPSQVASDRKCHHHKIMNKEYQRSLVVCATWCLSNMVVIKNATGAISLVFGYKLWTTYIKNNHFPALTPVHHCEDIHSNDITIKFRNHRSQVTLSLDWPPLNATLGNIGFVCDRTAPPLWLAQSHVKTGRWRHAEKYIETPIGRMRQKRT